MVSSLNFFQDLCLKGYRLEIVNTKSVALCSRASSIKASESWDYAHKMTGPVLVMLLTAGTESLKLAPSIHPESDIEYRVPGGPPVV